MRRARFQLVSEWMRSRCRRRRGRHHIDALAGAIEEHDAVGQGEQGVVAAAADVAARQELGAALPHDDSTRANLLPAVYLHPQTLRIRITPVAAGTLSLFVCHDSLRKNQKPRAACPG